MTPFRLPGSELLAEKRDAASGSGPVVVRVPREMLDQIVPLNGTPPDVVVEPMDEAQATLGQVDVSQTFRDADGTISVVEPDGNVSELPERHQDVTAPTVCDVCTAAKLAEDGVMPSRVPPDELHGRCKSPGSCTCGCPYSTGERCRNCGRVRPIDLLAEGGEDGPECVDRAECAKAMLDSAPAAPARAASKKATSTAPRPSRPPSDRPKQPKEPKQGRPCADGCGETTGGGTYRPGHDSKHVKSLVAAVRARGITLEAALGQLPSEALQAKLRKQLEAS